MAYLDLDHASDASAVRARLLDGTPLVACLCAEWCGSCREYREVFRQLAKAFPGLCFVWVDIENQAEVSDALDVENFPTVMIEDEVTTRFFGTLLPQRGILERLLGEFPQLPGSGAAPMLRPLLLTD